MCIRDSTYTIWANNSGGSSSATINITVIDEAPDISYSPDWFVLTYNFPMSPTATPTNTGGAIPSGIIDSTGDVGEHTSIAIDSYGYMHISYYDSTSADLKYATDKSGSWVVTTLDSAGAVGKYTSIAIDSNDKVYISYYDQSYGDLKFATDKSGSWVLTTVHSSGDVGKFTSIALNSTGNPVISYYDESGDDLKFAAYACIPAGCIWVTTTVDSAGSVGKHSSIVVDSNNNSHISYYDQTNKNLKYANSMSGSWVTDTVDNSGYVGVYTSIAIDSNDDIHIAYNDEGNDDLRYATNKSGSWVSGVTIDSFGDVGAHPSIAIDSNDKVHIAYIDWSNYNLKYATDKSGSWITTAVDSTGNVGLYSSIALDSNNAVHISYYDDTNNDLKYVVLDSSSNVYGYTISPALPAGLSLNFGTGEISGTPTALSTNTTYTITARNSGGVNTTTITIKVIDTVPTLSYSPENLTLTNNTASGDLPLAPTLNGSGVITSWGINGSLPAGLYFGTSNGTFWGIPTVLQSSPITYKIWANNSGGSSSATINITINDEVPTLSYSPENLTLTNNTASGDLPLNATLNGSGNITSWEINATLPLSLIHI